MAQDISEHPFSPENVSLENGEPTRSEKAWLRFCAECERLLGHDLDGCDDFTARMNNVGCGYSIDEAYESFEALMTAPQYVAMVQRRERYDHGAFVNGEAV